MCIRDSGYDVSVLDLRNPAGSDGNNLLDLVNKYMDAYMAHPDDLASRDVYKRQVENYVGAYLLNEQTKEVVVMRFFYGARDYKRLRCV